MRKYDLKRNNPRSGEAPFDSGRKMMSTVHSTDGKYIQYTKGAPDVVIGKCTHYIENGKIAPITEEYIKSITTANKTMADKALRVLACSMRVYETEPESYEPESLEEGLCFLGLCGMIDPVRPEVKAAIAECRTAGVRPIMITGDHIDTAVAIAKELGIIEGGIFTTDVTEYCVEGFVAEKNESTGTYSIEKDPYAIFDAEDLKALKQ